MTEAILSLPFVGKNFFRGIVLNSQLPFGKDAVYELLKGETYNWRGLLLLLGRRMFGVSNRLTSDAPAEQQILKGSETVLLVDDEEMIVDV